MEREELARRYAAGERNFSGCRLEGEIYDLDLSGVDLSGARAEKAYLAKVILKNANLQNARLVDVCLDGADLTGADLRGCILWRTAFGGANLTNADLRGARFKETSFARANLTGVNLANTELKEAIFREANLTGANLEGADLNRAVIENTIMPDVQVVTLPDREALRFGVVIVETEDGYYADCSELEGCQARGKSLQEAQANIKDAIQVYLDALSPDQKRMFIERSVWAMVLELEPLS